MASIYVFKRKRKGKLDKIYSAQIRFGEKHDGASYLRSTGVTDRREAEAVARKLARELEETELPRRGVEILTVEGMFSRWIFERGNELRSKKDIKWQIMKLLQFIDGAREVRDLSNKDINGFVHDAKLAGNSAVVINRCLETLRSVMNYAAMRWEEPVKVIAWKTFRQKEPKAREVYLSPEEARRLMELLPEHIALAFAFSLYTGCRLNELETLTWNRVDIERRAAMVITKAQGTDPVMRVLRLSKTAIKVLQTVENGLPRGVEVFDLTNRRKHWEKARAAIGRADLHWHDIRAMTATWARQYANADNTLIAESLGHADVVVTRRYTRVVDSEVVEMLDKLPDVTGQIAGPKQLSNLLSKGDAASDGEGKIV